MDHSVLVVKSNRTSALLRTLNHRCFESRELESLYHRYCQRSKWLTLLQILCLFSLFFLAYSLFHFIHIRGASLSGICLAVLSALYIGLVLILAYSRRFKSWLLNLANYLLLISFLIFALVMAPWRLAIASDSLSPPAKLSPADGLWEAILVIFVAQTMLTFRTWQLATFGVVVSLTHALASALAATFLRNYLWQQMLGNAFMLVWINVLGLFLHAFWEMYQRKTLVQIRNCVSIRIDMEREKDKLDRLLASVLPHHVASQVKNDVSVASPLSHQFRSMYLQQLKNVGILHAKLVNFSEITSRCTAQDLVRLLNEIYGRFDIAAKDKKCVRIRIMGSSYVVLSGLTETKSQQEHVQAIVELGLDIIHTMESFAQVMNLDVSVKVGITVGQAWSGIFGLRKWQYDIWSEDVLIAEELQALSKPSTVHVSEQVLRLLPPDFSVEEANGESRSNFLRAQNTRTYYIRCGLNKGSRHQLEQSPFGSVSSDSGGLRGTSGSLNTFSLRLAHHMKLSAEVPFSNVLPPTGSTGPKKVKSPKSIHRGKRVINPRRRGQGNQYAGDVMPVNSYLDESIKSDSIYREETKHTNGLTLRFTTDDMEMAYNNDVILWLLKACLCLAVGTVLFGAFHFTLLPRLVIPSGLFALALAWIFGLVFLLAFKKTKNSRCDALRNFRVQAIISLITLFLFVIFGIVNSLFCKAFWSEAKSSGVCYSPQYVTISCLVCILTSSLFLKLPSWLRLTINCLIGAVYIAQIFILHGALFLEYTHQASLGVPLRASSTLAIGLFIVVAYLQARRLESCIRLNFVWKTKLEKEREELLSLRLKNQRILENMLPRHVVCMFLDNEFVKSMDLYSQRYASVGVLFATICNFADMHAELSRKNQIAEAVHYLNDIICDFDELLLIEKFGAVEKVTAYGTTYMAAVGLQPENRLEATPESVGNSLATLVEFTFAMRQRIMDFSVAASTRLFLRAGIDVGPVVAGVIGAKKPQFNLWGKTVTTTQHMENTSMPNHIQITEEVHSALRDKPYSFECRGKMKNGAVSYFVTGRKNENCDCRHRGVELLTKPSPTKSHRPIGIALPHPSHGGSSHSGDGSREGNPKPAVAVPSAQQSAMPEIHVRASPIAAHSPPAAPSTSAAAADLFRAIRRAPMTSLVGQSPKSPENSRAATLATAEEGESEEEFSDFQDPDDQEFGLTGVPVISRHRLVNQGGPNFKRSAEESRSLLPIRGNPPTDSDASGGFRGFNLGSSKPQLVAPERERIDVALPNSAFHKPYERNLSPKTTSNGEKPNSSSPMRKRYRKKQTKSYMMATQRGSTVSSDSEIGSIDPELSMIDSYEGGAILHYEPITSRGAFNQPFPLVHSAEPDILSSASEDIQTDWEHFAPNQLQENSAYFGKPFCLPGQVVSQPNYAGQRFENGNGRPLNNNVIHPPSAGYAADTVEEVLLELIPSTDYSEALNGGFTDPVGNVNKPFPVTQEDKNYVNDPESARNPAYRGQSVGRSSNASKRLSTGTGKLFSETEYENARSDYYMSENESEYGGSTNLTERQFLEKTRLLVPGYNLSMDSISGRAAVDPNPNLKQAKDDSFFVVHRRSAFRRLGSRSGLEYLGIDTGHEADIDSMSSRCSSRAFDGSANQLWNFANVPQSVLLGEAEPRRKQQRRSTGNVSNGGYTSEYDNYIQDGRTASEKLPAENPKDIPLFCPEQISDMEIDFFDEGHFENLKKVTNDIQKSFGNYGLGSKYSSESDSN